MGHFNTRVTGKKKQVPTRADPARANDAGAASGPPGPLGRGQSGPSSAPWLRGSLPVERRTSASRVKGNAKFGPSKLTRPGSIGSVSHHMLRRKMKWSSACGLLLCVVELFGGRTALPRTALHFAPAFFFCEGKVCSSCCFERERATNEIKV